MTNPRRSLQEDHRLIEITEYILRNDKTLRSAVERADWSSWDDPDKERVYFRAKDSSKYMEEGHSRGMAIGIPLDALRYLENDQLIRIVGDRMLTHLQQGLAVMDHGEPYPKEDLRI